MRWYTCMGPEASLGSIRDKYTICFVKLQLNTKKETKFSAHDPNLTERGTMMDFESKT
jgi:hypothetical protein